MTADLNKNRTSIIYNHLNLPVKIVFRNDQAKKIEYLYDATGRKLRKKVTEGSTQHTTDYLDGFQYHNGALDFFPTDEGYVKNTVVNGDNHFNYVYNYTDHLGNIRLSYGRDPELLGLKVLEENNYYPFGLKHNNYNMNLKQYAKSLDDDEQVIIGPIAGNYKYNYKYNGKELQDELGLNLYDYGAMLYDPATGRRNNIDPLAEKSRRWSPYSYCFNNPLRFVDPDGMSPQDIIYFNLNGKEVKRVEQAGPDVKKMVLTTSRNEAKVNSAIGSGFVVSAFSNSESTKMGDIYKTAAGDKTSTEQGFMRGTNGESKVVTGTRGEVGPAQWADAKGDLNAKGSTATSDVHLHPNEFDASGNMTSYGLPQGSPTDVKPENNRGYTEPSVVLGYKEDVQPLPAGQIGGTPEVKYTPTAGFYDTNNNPIITVPFSDLQSTIKKIDAAP